MEIEEQEAEIRRLPGVILELVQRADRISEYALAALLSEAHDIALNIAQERTKGGSCQ